MPNRLYISCTFGRNGERLSEVSAKNDGFSSKGSGAVADLFQNVVDDGQLSGG